MQEAVLDNHFGEQSGAPVEQLQVTKENLKWIRYE